MLDKNDIAQIKTAINLLGIKSNAQILCDSRKIKRFIIDGKKPHELIKQIFNIKILPVLMERYTDSFAFEANVQTGIIKAAKLNTKNGKFFDESIVEIN